MVGSPGGYPPRRSWPRPNRKVLALPFLPPKRTLIRHGLARKEALDGGRDGRPLVSEGWRRGGSGRRRAGAGGQPPAPPLQRGRRGEVPPDGRQQAVGWRGSCPPGGAGPGRGGG